MWTSVNRHILSVLEKHRSKTCILVTFSFQPERVVEYPQTYLWNFSFTAIRHLNTKDEKLII